MNLIDYEKMFKRIPGVQCDGIEDQNIIMECLCDIAHSLARLIEVLDKPQAVVTSNANSSGGAADESN